MTLHFRRNVEMLDRFQWKAKKIAIGLEHITYEERLKKLSYFGLMKKKLKDDLIAMFNYLYSSYKDNEAQLFSLKPVQKVAKATNYVCMFRLDTGRKNITRKLACTGKNHPEKTWN